MDKHKTIVLVAHDKMKSTMIKWVKKHSTVLSQHHLLGTGTTAGLIENETSLSVKKLISGPLGGDQQIGSQIAEGKVDILIFFWDPLTAVAHNDDVRALLRIAVLWNIPVACNPASAEYLISSQHLKDEYSYPVIDMANYAKQRELEV